MARRGLLLAVAAALAFIGAWAQALAGPLPALACTCALPEGGLAALVGQPDVVVFTGTAGRQAIDRVPFTVTDWFHGDGAARIVFVRPASIPDGRGGVMHNTCGLDFRPGEWMFLVAHGHPPEPLTASVCSPHASLDTAEGQALVADATEVFGAPGAAPPAEGPAATTQPTEPPAVPAPTPAALDPTWLYVAAVIGGAGLIFAIMALLAVRRRPSG